tara:strand:- start:15 stop:1235 length:1221 start_codon:yes stop_codon:yes gene_type:complete
MNYNETISWLFSQLPYYQKKGPVAYKKNIDNINHFIIKHGHDYLSFDVIHVAGTNGKGSVCHMLSSILQESGLKVGLFTSPHLLDFRERIKINGVKIAKNFVVDFVQDYMHDFVQLNMSFFEMNVAMALNYFKINMVDIAIIEVGLGGRLDATNIISPTLSVITNVSLDHTNLLGNTIDLIAKEKAGIIKPGVPVLIGDDKIKSHVFEKVATKFNSPIFYAKKFNYSSDLLGDYQVLNINTSVTAVKILNQYSFNVSDEIIQRALNKVVVNTCLIGRWQVISKKPLIICDIAHNLAAVNFVMKQLLTLNNEKYIILGFSENKDIDSICKCLPKNYNYFLCGSNNNRIIDPNNFKSIFAKHDLNYKIYNFACDAYDDILSTMDEKNLIMITGSTFIVADILEYIDKS